MNSLQKRIILETQWVGRNMIFCQFFCDSAIVKLARTSYSSALAGEQLVVAVGGEACDGLEEARVRDGADLGGNQGEPFVFLKI